jgi:hypothetical protein
MIEKVKAFIRSGRLAVCADYALAGAAGAYVWAVGVVTYVGLQHADRAALIAVGVTSVVFILTGAAALLGRALKAKGSAE